MAISNLITRTLSVATVTVGCIVGQMVKAEASFAANFSINFNDLTAGDVVTNQYASQGVSFSTSNSFGGPIAAAISSATYPGASGIALRPENALPFNSTHLFSDIEISFAEAINYFSILSLDSDEPLTVRGFYQGNEVASLTIGAGSDLQVREFILDGMSGSYKLDKVRLDLVEGQLGNASGGPEFFDNLKYHTVPEPGAVGGLLALGLMGIKTLKSRKAVKF